MVRAALALALTGCELIAGVPDGVVGGDQRCTADRQCSSPRPLCDLATETCVECETSVDCPGARPVCSHGSCRACVADTECSDICLPDGSCADPSRIVYASPAGIGTSCSAAAPCDLDTAVSRVSPATDVVELAPGTYERSATVAFGATAILAGSGAVLHGAQPFGPVVEVTGGDLALVGLEIQATGQTGASCRMSGTLRVHRATISGGSVGVSATPCALVVDRSRIANSSATAIAVTAGPVSITSSFVVGNAAGGVALDSVASGLIAGTTIAGTTTASPVQCATSPSVAIASDIIYGNAALDPACAVSYSDLDPGFAGTGANDVAMDPMFVAPPTDYHLAPASPLRGLGDPASMIPVDFDGDARGSPPDPGADEIP